MEIYDWVDKNDNVIGQINKDESHKNGQAHRIAAVYVFNEDGKLLIQHRKKDGLLDHSVGGHVRSGETYDDAAKRELQEELGLIRDDLKKVANFYSDERSRDFGKGLQIVHYFGLYEMKLGKDKIIESEDEVEELIPMELIEIAELMTKSPEKFTMGFIRSFNCYIKQKNIGIAQVPVK